MLITDAFVFVHLERTGGNFVAKFIKEFFPSCLEIGYHYPKILTPPQYRHLPVIGFVRNPWDWYVSSFFQKIDMPFGCEEKGRNPFPESLFDVESFSRTTKNLLYLGRSEAPYMALKQDMLDTCPLSIEGNRAMGVTKTEIAAHRNPDEGFYSWLLRRMYEDLHGQHDDVLFGKFESLQTEVARILGDVGCKVSPEMIKYLELQPPPNPSKHEPYKQYYDDALQGEVRRQEQWVIDKFGYAF
jgi:hypothetical protein